MPRDNADAMSVLFIDRKSVDTVIFDFDGTLALLNIDFNRMRRDIQVLIASYGIDQTVLHHSFILEMIEETRELLQKSSRDASDTFIREAYRQIETIEVEAAKRGTLFQGTKVLLSRLRQDQIRVGIITRNCSRAILTVFPDITFYCPVVVCREDVHHVKPHPEQLHLALNRMGSQAERAIMIGDHPMDIETGRLAGTLTAGVLTGHFQETDFIRSCATIVLSEASDILKFSSPAHQH